MCDYTLAGICLTRPPVDSGFAIFGFSEFLAALALLVLVYNSSDTLYRFRIAIAPLPLFRLTFGSTVVIGLGTLLTDLWFAEGWYAPAWGASRAILQGIFGLLFLLTVLLWIWFAFIRPPIFGKFNYKHFYRALFHTVVRGSDTDLPVIAAELVRSGETLIRFSAPNLSKGERQRMGPVAQPAEMESYAHDILLMLANRKLCRHIVASSPITAIVLMEEASRQEKYHVPLGQFARNVTAEAILNKDSILYHEDDGYSSGLVGYVQPFSKAMYGDYQLTEQIGLGSTSPLDIDWRVSWAMSGDQFEAYCRITMITLKSFVESGHYLGHSYALYRAFEVIKEAGRDLYKLDMAPSGALDTDAVKRVSAAVRFIDEAIKFLGEKEHLKVGQLRVGREGKPYQQPTIFDNIAETMFELILSASTVKSPQEQAWWIQYNTVWARLFGFNGKSKAWRVIRFKITRLLFDEIKRMEKFPNFKSSRILGICLNVIGLSEPKRDGHREDYYSLTKAVLSWTKQHYLWLAQVHPRVAEDCLSGGISFDAENRRLVKTYALGLNLEPEREYLELDKPRQLVATGHRARQTAKPRRLSNSRARR